MEVDKFVCRTCGDEVISLTRWSHEEKEKERCEDCFDKEAVDN